MRMTGLLAASAALLLALGALGGAFSGEPDDVIVPLAGSGTPGGSPTAAGSAAPGGVAPSRPASPRARTATAPPPRGTTPGITPGTAPSPSPSPTPLAPSASAAVSQGVNGGASRQGLSGASSAPTTPAAVTLPVAPPHNCPVPDPSGTGGCITPAMGVLMAEVIRAFGDLPSSCWDRRDGDPYSDHPKGRACDYTMGTIGRYPDASGVALGWSLAGWLRANQAALHVNYVIWQGRIWSRAHDAEGWRPYTGGGYYPSTGPTYGHYDHVHVSTVD